MAMGFSQLPNTHVGIKQLVMQHGERIRSVVSLDMQRLKDMGQRFSVTLDEWTSTRNRRYMNVNVHADGTSSGVWEWCESRAVCQRKNVWNYWKINFGNSA